MHIYQYSVHGAAETIISKTFENLVFFKHQDTQGLSNSTRTMPENFCGISDAVITYHYVGVAQW